MSASFVTAYDGWDIDADADRRFRRITSVLLVLFIALGIAIPLLHLSGLQRGGGETLEQRYVSIIPDAPVAEQVEEPEPAPEDNKKPEQPKATPDKPVQDKPKAPPQPTEAERQAQARAVAKNSGVLAMADQLAELRDQSLHGLDTTRALSTERITAQAGTGASGGSSAAFADAATRGSGGIGATGTGDERRLQSGAGLGQRRTTTVEAPKGLGPDKTKPGMNGDKMVAGRSMNEIQEVFDRNKGPLLAIINRGLRDNPDLRGIINIDFTINPDGSVSGLRIASGSVGDPDIDRKLLQRIQMINFGPKSVPPFKVENYQLRLL